MDMHIEPVRSIHAEPLRGKRILIVDDSNDYREMLALRLKRLGAHIVTADSGFKALDLVQIEVLDVVLMDIQMPKMDGLRTIRLMREAGINLPIITVTALKDILKLSPNETRDIAAHAGKPTDIPDLVETIIGVLAIRAF